MVQRVAFGVIGFALVLLALFVFPPFLLELALAALGALATYELAGATRMVKNKSILTLCVTASFVFGILEMRAMAQLPAYFKEILPFALMILLFALVLKFHDKIQATEAIFGMFAALILPYFLLALSRIFQMQRGQFLVLMPLLAAWGSDTFALFAGMLFGKHKLAPIVSPKKTIEGAVGGIVGSVFCLLVFAYIMHGTVGFTLPYWAAIALGIFGSALGQVGDLSFSIIKRQTGIKDYGTIFPGHGGVLDRFDSVIFVAPAIEFVLRIFDAMA